MSIDKGFENIKNWDAQDQHVERDMDNAPFTSAHPDHTLVLAGPPRKSSFADGDGGESGTIFEDALPIGMLQNFNYNQSKRTQPVQTIGSARTFFTSSKAQVTFSMSRLFVNGRNLLHALYYTAVKQGAQSNNILEDFDHAGTSKDQHFVNLDSKLFYVPFGLIFLVRSVMDDVIGGGFVELCMLNSFSSGIRSGQSMIMENIQGAADRVMPLDRVKDGYVEAGMSDDNNQVSSSDGKGQSQLSKDVEQTFLDLGSGHNEDGFDSYDESGG